MNYIILPLYTDEERDSMSEFLTDLGIVDHHIVSDEPVVEAALPTTASTNEQMVLGINRHLAHAAAVACAKRANERWGLPSRWVEAS